MGGVLYTPALRPSSRATPQDRNGIAHRRLADAEIAYHRAIVDYNVAILQVHYRKNSLLEYNGILLTEDTLSEPRP